MLVWNVLHAARWKYKTQKIAKSSPSAQHRTTLSGCIFATKACINNRIKKLVKQQYLHMYHTQADRQRSGSIARTVFGDRLQNGSPYAMGPLSVCLSCLSVTLMYCSQTVEWIKMKLGTEVGLGPGHIVLDGYPAPLLSPLTKGHSPQFPVHVCCGQTAGWIKMPLHTEVNLGPGDVVLDGVPAPRVRGSTAAAHLFGPCLLWPWSPISALSLIHIWRCRRSYACRSRWSPYH